MDSKLVTALCLSILTTSATVEARHATTPPAATPPAVGGGFLGAQLDVVGSGATAEVRIVALIPDGPAFRAGLRASDTIVSVDSRPSHAVADVTQYVSQRRPNSAVRLVIRRNNREQMVNVTLGARPVIGVTLNNPAPTLVSSAIMGPGPANLAQLRGKVVVLDFWATWCGPCRATMPELDRMASRYGRQGLVVLGVSDESPEMVRQAGAEMNIHYTLASDAMAAGRFGVQNLPTIMVIDKQGIVRKVSVGVSVNELQQIQRLVERLLREP